MSKLIGKAPNQIPTNADLGSMAYQSTEYVTLEQMTITENSGLTLGGPKASQPRINFYNQYSTDGSTWWNITNEGNANRLSFRKYGQGPTVSIHDDANAGTLVISNDSRIETGNYTDSSDSADYGFSVFRKGSASNPATTSFSWAGFDYTALYGQGPSSYIQKGDFLNASYGRIVTGDADVEKLALIDISYDSGMSPLRLDGKGNMWLGHNRTAQWTSTEAHSLFANGYIAAGSYDPWGKMHIQTSTSGGVSSGAASSLWFRNTNGTAGASSNIFWGNSQASAAGGIGMEVVDNTNNYGALHFETRGTGGWNTGAQVIHPDARISYSGVMHYYNDVYLQNSGYYYFDIPVRSTNGTGQVFEIFAGYTHYGTSYAAVIKQVWSQRSNIQSDVMLIQSLINYTTAAAGAWTVAWQDATTIRVSKSAGSYGGSGYGYIMVRSPK